MLAALETIVQVQHLSHVLNIYARYKNKKGKKNRKKNREKENDTAWKLTKKHQHQVKLLLLQPA